jgi:uncharacterized membrane protein YjjB (DUF3815 family)
MAAAVVFLQIGFGLALGTKLLSPLGTPPPVAPAGLPAWAEWVALPLAALAFIVVLRARPRDLGWFSIAVALATLGSRLGTHWLGPELGTFGGAFLVGTVGNLRARLYGRPATTVVVPGVILIVPGSIGFRSMSAFLQRDVVSAVDTAFSMFMVAVSLVAGLLLANALFQPKRPL